MGTGDLNLLKSWNPKLVKNRKKVWEKEQRLLEEDEKIRKRQLEIAKEKEEEELLAGRDSTKGRKTGLEWMYQDDPTAKEDYLLGKKKLDTTVIKKAEVMEENQTPLTKINKTTVIPDAIYSKEDPMARFGTKVKRNKVVKKEPVKPLRSKTTNEPRTDNIKPKSDYKKRLQEELDY